MNIIYVTTAMNKGDFKNYLSSWKKSLNPSNQNFHEKMIRALALTNKVDVISLRPFSKKMCEEKYLKAKVNTFKNINYYYFKVERNKLFRPFSYSLQMNKLLSKLNKENSIIIADTINPQTIRLANQIKKKTKLPLIGICTDSPSNISNTRRSYTTYLLAKSKNLDGYICLTKGLNDLFNKFNKPNLIIEGIVEDYFVKNEKSLINDKPYFFFGGALLAKYGVYNLIEGFKKLNRFDISLLIAGHHENPAKLLEESKGYDIKFLGLLPVNEVMNYESFALANINPRPFSEDLDRYSIPSKTLEYLSSGRPTISIKNSKLQKYFLDDVIWLKDNDPLDIKKALESVLNLSEEQRKDFGRQAKDKVRQLYSISSVNKKLNMFINSFKKD